MSKELSEAKLVVGEDAKLEDDVGLSARRIFVSVNGRAVRDAGMIRAAQP